MTSRERFLSALQGGLPDRVPVAPDISNYIPCKLTSLPFWDIYWFGKLPLWEAYLRAVDVFGFEAWFAASAGPPFVYAGGDIDWSVDYSQESVDCMVKRVTARTPDGMLAAEEICRRHDPPAPRVKLAKNLPEDFDRLRHVLKMAPAGINQAKVERMRQECQRRQQAFGLMVSYPGFQHWQSFVEGGVEALSYAWADCPQILDEWLELDMVRCEREMRLALSVRPDYLTLGGSGTITLASPELARRFALPAIKKLSAMAKSQGVPVNLHSCGKSRSLVQMLVEETNVSSVNPLEVPPMGDADLAEMKRLYGGRIGLMGNLHTTELMLRGSPEQVRERSIQAMRDAGEGGGFILSTGDQCPPGTPPENIAAMIAAAREYGQYDSKGRLPRVEEYYANRRAAV